MSITLSYTATTLAGLEEVLERELIEFGATKTNVLVRAVAFDGPPEIIYKVNLWSRVALQVMIRLTTSEVNSPDDIYECTKRIYWDKYFRSSDTFAVHAVVNDNKFINNSLFAALKVKDAVVEQLRESYGFLHSFDKYNPDININVHISRTTMNISLNSTGIPLFKRGYKMSVVASPLNEVLAAGILALSGWNKHVPLFDPFCGSGTILIEGAMMSANVAPGLYRESFGFMRWKDYDRRLWATLLEEAKSAMKFEMPDIIGSDISARAVSYAMDNIQSAGFADFISVKRAAFGDFVPPLEDGYIVTNPPYGVRTENDGLLDLYKKMGEVFKHQFKGFSCWVISSEKEAIDNIGLHACSQKKLFNGPLECRLMGYKMY